MIRYIFSIVFIFVAGVGLAQHSITIDATLNPASRSLDLVQEIRYENTSQDTLYEILLLDWANSFSDKTTPLAERFGENFDNSFQFEKEERRGRTAIYSIAKPGSLPLEWERGDELDIVKVVPDQPLLPGASIDLRIMCNVRLPDARLTRYGVTNSGDYLLQYWYLSPAVYQDGKWEAYSNKNVQDIYQWPTDYKMTFHLPRGYQLTSDLEEVSTFERDKVQVVALSGDQRIHPRVYIEPVGSFRTIETDKLTVVTNMDDRKVTGPIKALAIDRIVQFLDKRLGPYPFEKMVVSDVDYRTNPVYGLNQLPNFISPFPPGFEYEVESLKTILRQYIENVLPIHPRRDHWLIGALQIYLMIQYVDQYYPNMKVIGSLSNWWVIRWSHASDLEFNDQYPLLYLNMARNNLHQSLVTPKDSLLKFNKEIASDYYAGDGLNYLNEYLGEEAIGQTLSSFYQTYSLKPTGPEQFQETLESHTDLPVNWFFQDYVGRRTTIDFKIRRVKKQGDSLKVIVANLKDNTMPVSLYGLGKDTIAWKRWLPPISDTLSVTVPREGVRKLALNYKAEIPEYNQRNNYKRVTTWLNRPVQFRVFKDVEDPKYNQVFFMPVFNYNIYDGLSLGPKVYNKTVLRKGVHYSLQPQWAFKSNTIVGSGSISYTQFTDEENLFSMRYGISGSIFSYDVDLFYKRFSPYMNFRFRNSDLRSNERQFINIRNVNVLRDEDPAVELETPNYSVFNAQYVYSNQNLVDFFRGEVDYQIAEQFSKISVELEYRKLFLSNRQLNLRFYAGTFLFNDTPGDDDFFSFALDRPTDYLFDYNYYGRSEDTGLFSQQYIVAEGGFKSQLEPAFANRWIATVNASTNIWKWIYAYADAGLVKNSGRTVEPLFDTGVRVSLVADYFELFFPLYSSLGWEPGLGNYDQRIRFIVTLDLRTLLGLFTRRWY